MTRSTRICEAMLCIALVMMTILGSVSAQTLNIRANENEFPATYQKGGKWEGMDIDVLSEILGRAKLGYQIISMPFRRSMLEARDGRIHIIPNLVKNDERSQYLHWLGPIRTTCIGLVVQKKDLGLLIQSTDDLITVANQLDLKVGYLSGASYSDYFDDRIQNDTELFNTLHFLPSNDQHRKMLKLGRILGYVHDAFEVQRRFADPDFAADYEGLALHPYRIEDSCNGAYIGISKQLDASIFEQINRSYHSMQEDGSLAAIYHKWIAEDPAF